MKKLTLIRHAKSDWHSAAETDFERPLNGRGKKAAPLMGQRLANKDLHPDILVSSPAKRARQTAKRIARELSFDETHIAFEKDIYEASRQQLVELLQNLDDSADHAVLFGHNPGFSELGQWLCTGAPEWLPTCAALTLELPVKSWDEISRNCGRILDYDYPKKSG